MNLLPRNSVMKASLGVSDAAACALVLKGQQLLAITLTTASCSQELSRK